MASVCGVAQECGWGLWLWLGSGLRDNEPHLGYLSVQRKARSRVRVGGRVWVPVRGRSRVGFVLVSGALSGGKHAWSASIREKTCRSTVTRLPLCTTLLHSAMVSSKSTSEHSSSTWRSVLTHGSISSCAEGRRQMWAAEMGRYGGGRIGEGGREGRGERGMERRTPGGSEG